MNGCRQVVVWCVLSWCSGVLHAQENPWRGFRGGEAQGRTGARFHSLNWSAPGGVQWKAPIPGTGVSSPVLTSDRVYLTSSWTSDLAVRKRRWIVLAQAVCAGIALYAWLRRTRLDRRLWAVGLAASLAVILAPVWWPGSERWVNSPIRAAAAGSLQMVGLGVAAAGFLHPRGWRHWLLMASLLAIPLFWLAWGVPAPRAASRTLANALVALVAEAGLIAIATVQLGRLRDMRDAGPRWAVWPLLAAMPLTVMGARLVTTGATDVRAVVAVDRRSGEVVWVREVFDSPRSTQHFYNSAATPTPVVAGDTVFAYFGNAGLVAVDSAGRVLWKNKNLPYRSLFGAGASPVEHDGVLVISSGGPAQPYVAGIQAATGAVLWKNSRRPSKNVDGNNRTPVIVRIKGESCAVIWDVDEVACLSVRTGRELFLYRLQAPLRVGPNTSSIVSGGQALFLADENGAVRLDLDALEKGRDPVKWFSKGPGADCASPVLVNGMLFMINEDGIASARDAITGKVVWEASLPDGEYFASPVTDGESVLFCNRQGDCAFVDAARPDAVVARNTADGLVMATPAAFDGTIYIRSERRLTAIGRGSQVAGKSR